MRFIALFLALLMPGLLSAMEFKIERMDLRPLRPPTVRVYASGPIVFGDTERLSAALAATDMSEVRDILFLFDSPGGSVIESLNLGEFIASLSPIVSAQVGSSENGRAICASACVYAFVAADYRYVVGDALIGVHQFGIGDLEIDGRQGAALGQVISGVLSEYLRANRVGPELFEMISSIKHDDIMWIPRQQLEEWRVVTNNVFDERETYINIDGSIGLQLTHIANTGESHMILTCRDGDVSGVVSLHEPEHAVYGRFEITINEIPFTIPSWKIAERQDFRSRILFHLPREVAVAALSARRFGARVVAPSEYYFFGFDQRLRDGLVPEMVRGCLSQPGVPMARTPGSPRMTDIPGTDFTGNDLTTNGFRGISFERCKEICLEYGQCRAVSYIQAQSWCWPKGGTLGQRRKRGIISAVKN